MAGEIKQFKDVNNNTHKVDITGVEGLQTALDGKAASNHTHSGIVGAYNSEYVKLENNNAYIQGDFVEISASDNNILIKAQENGTIELKIGSSSIELTASDLTKLRSLLDERVYTR